MLDENLIATLEETLRKTRNAQNRMMARLREVELESERLREEIAALENSASQTESAIDSLLVTMRSGSRSRNLGSSLHIEDDYSPRSTLRQRKGTSQDSQRPRSGSISYFNQGRGGVPSRTNNIEPISHRFADRTITQACTLLLREAGSPLHVNELYNLLVAGGMEFKGNNPTISVAVSLNRNRRFRKVGPGTFDLMMRDASHQAAS
ncbi:MAG TPA: hypothetical protein VGQ55_05310 [Pyrinomonadaceae bacterium]|jgi:hypothetical protein|nr:hypothetical protein [Pyrinomonadaceae bacterium]